MKPRSQCLFEKPTNMWIHPNFSSCAPEHFPWHLVKGEKESIMRTEEQYP